MPRRRCRRRRVIGNKSNESRLVGIEIDRNDLPQHVRLYIDLLQPILRDAARRIIERQSLEGVLGTQKITLAHDTTVEVGDDDNRVTIKLPAQTSIERRIASSRNSTCRAASSDACAAAVLVLSLVRLQRHHLIP